MKKIGLLLLIFAAIAWTLPACGNEDDNAEPASGTIKYDGKTLKVKVYYIDLALPGSVGSSSYSCLTLTNTHSDNGDSPIQTTLYIGNPRENLEYEVTFSSGITFMYDQTYYSSLCGFYNDSETGGEIWAIKSHSIDPKTGNVIFKTELCDTYKGITGGQVKWTAGRHSAKLEFDLALEGGKTVKGNATIPYSVFEN